MTAAGGFTVCGFGAADEALHRPSADDSYNESVYFEWIVAQPHPLVGGIVRIGMRPNENYREMSLVMPLSDGSVVFRYERTELGLEDVVAGSPRWRAAGMTLEAVEPTRRWRVGFEGEGPRLVDDRSAFAEEPGRVWRESAPIHCGFELEWEGDFPLHALSGKGDILPGQGHSTFARSHYEQFGRIGGTIEIGDERWPVAATGFRDHSWGPRIWDSAPDQDFVTAYLADGGRIVAVRNRGDGRDRVHGIDWSPGAGEPVPLQGYRLLSPYGGEPLPDDPLGFAFTTVAGAAVEVRGPLLAAVPLRLGSSIRLIHAIVGSVDGAYVKADLMRPRPAG